ncbi:response regulator transcription factor [Motilibacter aurantiacus]|uniref:response regulator transcription factor n=1 Tax=Motilibacter aurantiacus TaxID=2714955 RepID=UPI001407D3C8|nr:response regulator transcription factor [Motilibacter aurantiacus]NHC44987.1 response regulator transcription factor [Motilibacter aurantiacus]
MLSLVIAGSGTSLAGLLDGDPTLLVLEVTDDAAQAARLAGLHRPDVVLLDLGTDGAGGETVRAVLSATSDTKVLCIARQATPAVIAELLAAGATGLLDPADPPPDPGTVVRAVADGHVVLASPAAGAAWRELLPPSG